MYFVAIKRQLQITYHIHTILLGSSMTAILAEHWNMIFNKKKGVQLGWYESDVKQSLRLLSDIEINKDSYIYLPGAGTSLLVEPLLAMGAQVTANDISHSALSQLKESLGSPHNLHCQVQDISLPLYNFKHSVSLWIDRAVLHFLLEEEQIKQYFENLNQVTAPAAYVLLAEFSPKGAKRCAGLKVHPYSIEEFSRRLGPNFSLVKHENHTFLSPSGEPKPYIYALFQKH